jgi:hypothetical protein
MMRIVAALLAASLTAQIFIPAVCASVQAAEPFEGDSAAAAPRTAGRFEVVPLETPPNGTHRLAWASLLTGAGLIGLSFALTDRANQNYDDYLVATDPAQAEHLYDRTRHFDRLSAASLLTGEALLATAVWLRFLRPRPASRVALVAGLDRCAVTLRF